MPGPEDLGATPPAFADVDALLHTLATAPDDAGGEEDVTFLAHALQAAAVARQRRPDDVVLHVAALVHDVGSALVPGDLAGHGVHGAAAVAPLLGARVAALVELHVPAKRYLVATDARYARRLSATSVASLGEQGGVMSAGEAEAFARHPVHRDAVVLRRVDDAAKVAGRRVPGLDGWRSALVEVSRRRGAG